MAVLLTSLTCFAILLGVNSASYQNVYKNDQDPKSESDLRRHLFQNYDKLVRPVKNSADQISVAVGMTPLYVRELDEKNQAIVLDSWLMVKWTDEYLVWEPSQFGNLSVLNVPSTEVWRPDISNYPAISDSDLFPNPRSNVLLYNNGDVLWVPLFQFKSRCPLSKTKKVITCNLKIGSWTFSEPLLDVQLYNDKVDLTNFSDQNPDWKLVEVVQDRVSKHYPCCVEAYPSINFNVTVKRRTNEALPGTPISLQDIVIPDRYSSFGGGGGSEFLGR